MISKFRVQKIFFKIWGTSLNLNNSVFLNMWHNWFLREWSIRSLCIGTCFVFLLRQFHTILDTLLDVWILSIKIPYYKTDFLTSSFNKLLETSSKFQQFLTKFTLLHFYFCRCIIWWMLEELDWKTIPRILIYLNTMTWK